MLHLFDRLKSKYRLKTTTGIWFHPLYIFHMEKPQNIGDINNRAKMILTTLIKNKLITAAEFRNASPIYWGHLHHFHTKEYIQSTTLADYDFMPIGLPLTMAEGEGFRESMRRMTQATVEGLSELVLKKLKITINLGGGFHHASPEKGSGFCLYNDLGTAIKIARLNHYHERILIIDLDFHQGNGNLEGLTEKDNVYHFQISGDIWHTFQLSNTKEIILNHETNDEIYLKTLFKELPDYLNTISPSLVCYIAGNDVLANDFFGKFNLSLKGVFQRDQFVIEQCRKRNIPIHITLGGGYGPTSWKASANMIKWVLTDNENINYLEPPERVEFLYNRFLDNRKQGNIKRKKGDIATFTLEPEDILGPQFSGKKYHKILNYYSLSHLEYAMNEVDIPRKLRRKGHKKFWLEVSQKDNGQDLIRLHSLINHTPHILIEALINVQVTTMPNNISEKIKLLHVEWLLAQNPLQEFTQQHPKLPGQEYPGLGLASEILAIFTQSCERLGLDGIIHNPSFYHIALKGCRHFKYLNPETEGLFRAMAEKLQNYHLADATCIIEKGHLLDQNKQQIKMPHGPMVFPVSPKLKHYFLTNAYLNKSNLTKNAILNQLSIKE